MRQVNPRAIAPDLYNRFQHNDQHTSWAYAFDYDLLKRNDAKIDRSIEYVIDGDDLDLTNLKKETVLVGLKSDYRTDLRLDTVLSKKLGISRRMLEDLSQKGQLQLLSDPASDLKQRLKDNIVIAINLRGLEQCHRT